MELRFMDELFGLEKGVGEVVGIIGLCSDYKKINSEEEETIHEKFEKPPTPEAKTKPAEGEEGADGEGAAAEEAPAEGEEGKKAPAFKKEDY